MRAKSPRRGVVIGLSQEIITQSRVEMAKKMAELNSDVVEKAKQDGSQEQSQTYPGSNESTSVSAIANRSPTNKESGRAAAGGTQQRDNAPDSPSGASSFDVSGSENEAAHTGKNVRSARDGQDDEGRNVRSAPASQDDEGGDAHQNCDGIPQTDKHTHDNGIYNNARYEQPSTYSNPPLASQPYDAADASELRDTSPLGGDTRGADDSNARDSGSYPHNNSGSYPHNKPSTNLDNTGNDIALVTNDGYRGSPVNSCQSSSIRNSKHDTLKGHFANGLISDTEFEGHQSKEHEEHKVRHESNQGNQTEWDTGVAPLGAMATIEMPFLTPNLRPVGAMVEKVVTVNRSEQYGNFRFQ